MSSWSTKRKVFVGIGLYFVVVAAVFIIFGSSGKNDGFQPQNEFKLDPWLSLDAGFADFSLNKAVLYIFLAAALTIAVMTYIANRMKAEPNRVQMAVELAYDLTQKNITRDNLNTKMATKWFPFLASLFFFIWFSNMLGYLPLPTNTEHKVDVFGAQIPAFAIYAATANISFPLAFALVVTVIYHYEGVKQHGAWGYVKGWLPSGLEDMPAPAKFAIWMIELISHLVRPISLSVRLFANILSGHLLILFMGGGLAVLLGISALGALTFPMVLAFFLFEIGLVATLQAFIFSTLTAIYIGGATAESH